MKPTHNRNRIVLILSTAATGANKDSGRLINKHPSVQRLVIIKNGAFVGDERRR